MKMPNFIIIGAPRAGTTALHYYLTQHPQVYMSSQKEPNFFAFENGKVDFRCPDSQELEKNLVAHSTPTLEAYHHLFRGVTTEIAIGEASPLYLASPGTPQRIKQQIPDVKLIAILRDPVERAYSHFTQSARGSKDGNPAEFMQVLHQEEQNGTWGEARFFVHQGLYYTYLKRYLEVFDHSQVKTYLFEDFESYPEKVMQDLFTFIGVDSTFIPDISVKYNTSGIAKNKSLDFLLSRGNPIKPILKKVLPGSVVSKLASLQTQVQNQNLIKAPTLTPKDRRELIEKYFKADILRLQDLIQRDLSIWLK